jgi:hypothetical protein
MGNPAAGQFKPGQELPDVAEKWGKALALRRAGATFAQIARQVGYAEEGAAHKAVMSAIKATLREPAEEVRTLEVERLDRLMLGVWQRAIDGKSEAIDRVLKIMDRRARLLGLDAPRKLAATDPDGKMRPPIRLVEVLKPDAPKPDGDPAPE